MLSQQQEEYLKKKKKKKGELYAKNIAFKHFKIFVFQTEIKKYFSPSSVNITRDYITWIFIT
jgi:hypothetical protein